MSSIILVTLTFYIWTLLLGAVGLGAMALSGLGSHSHSGHGTHGHSHGGHGHGGHAHGGHSHAGHANAGQAHAGHSNAGHTHGVHGAAAKTLWTFMSPRFLFSLCLGFGTAGVLLRPMLDGPVLFAAALLGGVVFERFVVSPLWNFTMRFASTPATMLESAIDEEATAVTSFDANGQGIVSIEVDGQIVQILATLRKDDRLLGGARVRAGQRVRVEAVDADKNCCTVSLL